MRKKNEAAAKKMIVYTRQATEFIYAQPISAVTKMLQTIKELGEEGSLGMPFARKIDKELFEVRVRDSGNQYRVFYCYAVRNLIYILNGFVKKTKETPLAEIRKAHALIRQIEEVAK